jgi:HAAS domain-containing protein
VTSRQSSGEADKLVRRYVAQLDAALHGVDASRREEILAELQGHIEKGRAGLDPDDAAGVRTLLDRVGDPLPSRPRQARRLRAAAAGTRGHRG